MTTISVVCDEPNSAHPRSYPRPVICQFVDEPPVLVEMYGVEFTEPRLDEWWQVIPRDGAKKDNERLRSVVALAGAQPVRWSDLDGPSVADRTVFEVSCPWCRRPQQFRDANLFFVLDKLASAGVHEVALAGISGIMGTVARRNR